MTAPENRGSAVPDRQIEAVQRAVKGGATGDDCGEVVTWRGHSWTVADVQNDGQHVHLTLTNPRYRPWSDRTTNDG